MLKIWIPHGVFDISTAIVLFETFDSACASGHATLPDSLLTWTLHFSVAPIDMLLFGIFDYAFVYFYVVSSIVGRAFGTLPGALWVSWGFHITLQQRSYSCGKSVYLGTCYVHIVMHVNLLID